jgi:hypothetical protein
MRTCEVGCIHSKVRHPIALDIRPGHHPSRLSGDDVPLSGYLRVHKRGVQRNQVCDVARIAFVPLLAVAHRMACDLMTVNEGILKDVIVRACSESVVSV